ncbi:RNA polymerase-binding protein DksA [Buchnera aphidicola]|uniref:RNA polymerase-binding transcription factor DksA n=1 Tax=Buchnera aphidicola subsp. Tuberolachnus salignus TaxID=98804 RepID=A0A160SWV8_BUCTT|nr:RNA polymerase-binding protein DksA [Buchnera aphidicola]CUR53118.1 RNA polymerase-binding transcription factor DksA [Buchnera aphidicola (Tuberolachnus salignus)]
MKKKNFKNSLNLLFQAGLQPYKQKKNEKYMNLQQLKHFKIILETWKKKINKIITKNVFNIQDKSINLPDPIDRASQEEEINLELRNRDREYKIITKINNTLKRIENSTFGYCITCEIEIGIKRLEAQPIANLCIDCQTLSELKKKQIYR